ncbi:hypothetical protein C8R45DRAFT_967679 [Mycena sanguinolenta]|nr:hypothetical protein C8R45DRAFT_967679 [Mycena sanguinolenta]
MFRFTILCLFLFFSAILAAPLDSRTAFAPPITSPTAQSVWKVGQVETVTWNASGIPAGVTGMIQLGFLDPNSEGEHLSTILASGFNLTDEKANITVPSVVTRTTYIIVLFGDSGNTSPEFTIEGTSASSGSGTSSVASTSGSTGSDSAGSTSSPPEISVTPSPPIITGSSIFSLPFSTSTAPSSAPTAQSQSSSLSTSASVSASASASASLTSGSPSPSPSANAGWRTTFKTYQVIMTPALALLLFI